MRAVRSPLVSVGEGGGRSRVAGLLPGLREVWLPVHICTLHYLSWRFLNRILRLLDTIRSYVDRVNVHTLFFDTPVLTTDNFR